MGTTVDERRDLVFAVSHEIGNLVAAIRLEAHLLDEESGPLGLARAALSIDDLSAQVGALLTLQRPLLDPPVSAERGHVAPAALLANLREALGDRGSRGVAYDVSDPGRLPNVVGDPERTNALLLLLALGAVDAASPDGSVHVRVRKSADRVEITVEDDGPEDSELADWRGAARRGRALVLQVAEAVLGPLGGAVSLDGQGEATRVVVSLSACAAKSSSADSE